MAAIPGNPFITGTMITTEEQFVGRSREIAAILARIRNADSVSVVGERRIGKSSLLYRLLLTGNKLLNDIAGTRFQFLYLDSLCSLFAAPADFVMEILTQLGVRFAAADVNANLLKAFTRGLQEFAKGGKIPVLLIDEFEKLTEKDSPYTDPFFENFRSCCTNHLAVAVTASRCSLKELITKNSLTSGFWNIFTNVPLQEFTDAEVVEFLFHFWQGKFAPTLQEQVFLLTYPSRHPLVLQVVSSHLLQNRSDKLEDAALQSYFITDGERIKRWLKGKGKIAAEKISWTMEFVGKQVQNIGQILSIFGK